MIPALKDEPKCAFPSWQYLDGSVFRDGVIPAKVGDEEDEAEGEEEIDEAATNVVRLFLDAADAKKAQILGQILMRGVYIKDPQYTFAQFELASRAPRS